MTKELLYILIGGGFGSIGRYLISEYVPLYYKKDFPLSTFIANIVGCFIIGIFVAIILPSSDLDALLVTGFCGGFTTFSSFSKETFLFLQQDKIKMAFLYAGTSTLVGIIAVLIGYSLVGH